MMHMTHKKCSILQAVSLPWASMPFTCKMMKRSACLVDFICDKLIFKSLTDHVPVFIYIIISDYRLSLYCVSIEGKFMKSEVSLWVPGLMIATERVESVVVFTEVRFWQLLCGSAYLSKLLNFTIKMSDFYCM